ncbi:uncharacterized protein LOC121248942 isoform X2 [Juglans microcarpa x Juglans regia]|nr:uncharacterized protein LOC121248942 isoform X2 [Juglans microcarpa x Juglans regia]
MFTLALYMASQARMEHMYRGVHSRILGIPIYGRKEKDHEELVLFKELHKRDKERILNLLQPVSEDFESHAALSAGSTGTYPFYRIPSAKKGPGLEFLAENGKNDYDWLKTPPATPLFPSLEMEAATAPELVVQREIPITQPVSRFGAVNFEAPKASNINGRPKSPRPTPKVPQRSTTPSQRPRILSTDQPSTKATTTGTSIITNQKPVTDVMSKRTNMVTNIAKSTNQKEILTSNPSKNTATHDPPKTKPRSSSSSSTRGVSPLVRSRITAQIPDFSNETPPNLRTDNDRSISATRGRPANPILPVQQKSDPPANPRRQSCSPSVTRGRKVVLESKQADSSQGNNNVTAQRGRTTLTGNVLGSRMVDKVMNARKSGAEGRESKPKSRGFNNKAADQSSGFGRMMQSKTTSLDMAMKQGEIKRDCSNSSHHGVVPGRRSGRE